MKRGLPTAKTAKLQLVTAQVNVRRVAKDGKDLGEELAEEDVIGVAQWHDGEVIGRVQQHAVVVVAFRQQAAYGPPGRSVP